MSITKKSIRSLIVLALALFIGTVASAGYRLYRANLRMYEDAGKSVAGIIAVNIDVDPTEKLIENLDAFSDYIRLDIDPNENTENLTEEEKEFDDLYRWYDNTWMMVLSHGFLMDKVERVSVVIPKEEGILYLWDTEDVDYLLKIVPGYRNNEKENLMKAMDNDSDAADLCFYNDNGKPVAVSMMPIYGYDYEPIAIVTVEMSLAQLRSDFLKIMFSIATIITLIMATAISLYYLSVNKGLIEPIRTLTDSTSKIVENLKNEENFKVDIHTGDEIEVLAHSFEEMSQKLREYIEENEKIASEKERITTELNLASRIQNDMLPNDFPAFPDRHEFDLYASMTPAKDVGGDFYDYFLLDDDHLALVMADVSGKGIPGALFMMVSMIMIQIYAFAGKSPAEVLETINHRICYSNTTEMFVTVWLGYLDLRSGEIIAANAGHEYPIIRNTKGVYEFIKDKHGFVVGGMDDMKYQEYKLKLEPGMALFLYTDGLPEATDRNNQMFGNERIIESLNGCESRDPHDILNHVSESVAAFVKDAEPFDDLTMLCLNYNGPESTEDKQ